MWVRNELPLFLDVVEQRKSPIFYISDHSDSSGSPDINDKHGRGHDSIKKRGSSCAIFVSLF